MRTQSKLKRTSASRPSSAPGARPKGPKTREAKFMLSLCLLASSPPFCCFVGSHRCCDAGHAATMPAGKVRLEVQAREARRMQQLATCALRGSSACSLLNLNISQLSPQMSFHNLNGTPGALPKFLGPPQHQRPGECWCRGPWALGLQVHSSCLHAPGGTKQAKTKYLVVKCIEI